MDEQAFEARVGGIAALDHSVSRAAYRLLVERGWRSRDEVAEALGLPRSVAAFHLDKLEAAGLLQSRFERTTGRSGPGAGRPAKLYHRVATEIALSLPERRYDLAGSVLAEALERTAGGVAVEHATGQAARDEGRRAGAAGRGRLRPSSRPAERRRAVIDVLAAHGYEPLVAGEDVVLANCPFHSLAQRHRPLVCGMNLDFLGGVLEGLELDGQLRVRLAPEPGHCCVRIGVAGTPAPPG